jgi:hypothetical protein
MRAAMTNKKSTKLAVPSARAGDQPATRKMLGLVRDELKSDIRSLELKMESELGSVRAEMAAEFGSVRAEMAAGFGSVRAEVGGLRSEMSGIRAEVARMHLLLEEQNANNRIVLEGLQALWQRQDRLEQQFGSPRS